MAICMKMKTYKTVLYIVEGQRHTCHTTYAGEYNTSDQDDAEYMCRRIPLGENEDI